MISPETRQQIRDLCAKGWKARQVSRMLNVGLRTVYRHGRQQLKQRAAAAQRRKVERDKAIFRQVYRGARTAEIAEKEALTQNYVATIVRDRSPQGYRRKPGCTWQTSPTRRLEMADVLEIIRMRDTTDALSVAKRYGVSRMSIYHIWNRRRWSAAWEVYDSESSNESTEENSE